MSTTVLIILVFVGIIAFGLLLFGLGIVEMPFGGGNNNLRNLVQGQRNQFERPRAAGGSQPRMNTDSFVRAKRAADSRLTIEKKLKFARWTITPTIFRMIELAAAIVVFSVFVFFRLHILSIFGFIIGPVIVRGVLNHSLNKRSSLFEKDYAPFLLSLVGLLKTGMNQMSAMQAAVEGLDQGSLMRLEIELMLERLRVGTTEDQSIGLFAEDVYHPEIELFVQALLLSKRVGGNLSDTLDRLARQVRSRQHFKQAAQASVSQQRGSIWVILAVLVGLEFFIYRAAPQLVTGLFTNPVGFMVFQGALGVIMFGIYWIREVTNIRL